MEITFWRYTTGALNSASFYKTSIFFLILIVSMCWMDIYVLIAANVTTDLILWKLLVPHTGQKAANNKFQREKTMSWRTSGES